jgi:hypothetical protein
MNKMNCDLVMIRILNFKKWKKKKKKQQQQNKWANNKKIHLSSSTSNKQIWNIKPKKIKSTIFFKWKMKKKI